MAAPDRIEQLAQQDAVVGLDFIYVEVDQQTLSVFFHPLKSKSAEDVLGAILPGQIFIHSPSGGESLSEVAVAVAPAPSWTTVDGRRVLRLQTVQPGDFSCYRLRLDAPPVDPFFNDVSFSFKANCPSDLDCRPGPHECPPETPVDFPVNYLARDFWSLRQALLDFAAERHPSWQDRLEADLGMMLAEVMSATGDELAYCQDRAARETSLGTATQRRSVRRHAGLVDYHLHDGKGATTWLDFQVNADGVLTDGEPVRDTTGRVVFEAGGGLQDGDANLSPALGPGRKFPLRLRANELKPYQWDENESCLAVGATSLYLQGHHAADLPLDDPSEPNPPGKWVLLQTAPADAAVRARAWLVRLIEVTEEFDSLLSGDVTLVRWEEDQATPFELEYESLAAHGNIVPATAGETRQAFFQIEPECPLPPALPAEPALVPGLALMTPRPDPEEVAFAVEREGLPLNPPERADEEDVPAEEESRPTFLFTLPGSEARSLTWLGPEAEQTAPEVRLIEGHFTAGAFVAEREWEWKRSLLGGSPSEPADRDFTLDDGAWRRVAAFRRVDEAGVLQEYVHRDYASGSGATVRFGNDVFGRTPARGSVFRVVYRLSQGQADKVAAGMLTQFDAAALPFVETVRNPFDVTDSVAPETLDEARQLAPEAFRAVTYRAVRPEDYAEAVERLTWVQRAGAEFRWTGSWLTLFATADPRGSFTLAPNQQLELGRQLDRFRLAAREAYGRPPKFMNLDLRIHLCVAPTAFRGEVEGAALQALFGRGGVRPQPGFFSPDRWTFGAPLERAQLEAALQSVPGVKAVEEIYIRARGAFDWRLFREMQLVPAADEIIRVENDRELPERGAVHIVSHGGA